MFDGFFSSKFELIFAVSALCHNQVFIFVYVFCWNNEYILGSFSGYLSSEGLGKTYIHFSDNNFPIDTVIIKLVIIYRNLVYS